VSPDLRPASGLAGRCQRFLGYLCLVPRHQPYDLWVNPRILAKAGLMWD
jgi:hypothetical protein